MSYASVVGQQMYEKLDYTTDGTTNAGQVTSVFRKDLVGTYVYTVIFKCSSTSTITSCNIVCGNSTSKEAPYSNNYAKTFTGVFNTGEFLIQTNINSATAYDIKVNLLKIA
jgi:hypothetical protein